MLLIFFLGLNVKQVGVMRISCVRKSNVLRLYDSRLLEIKVAYIIYFVVNLSLVNILSVDFLLGQFWAY